MSVGVMGDQRTYAYTCAVRAVHSEDGMTADWVPLPYEVLKTISNRIVNEVRGVNRVVYDITSSRRGRLSGNRKAGLRSWVLGLRKSRLGLNPFRQTNYHIVMPVDTETSTSSAPRIRAPRGTTLSCKGWQQEAAMRMLMNNLDEEVAERPQDLVVYGGTGKAARNWDCYHAIVGSLKNLENDETLLVQSGKPVGVFKTHEYAPRVLIANSNLVGHFSNWEKFNELERAGLMMYGQMTAGSWIYIGSQGIVQGTYETFNRRRRQTFRRRSEWKVDRLWWHGRHGWSSTTCSHNDRRGFSWD